MAEPGQANIELKLRCADPAHARAAIERVATSRVGVDRQVDTYFTTRNGRLKLRESSLSGGQLIPYLRPDAPAARLSSYRVIPVPDPVGTRDLLSQLLGVHAVVSKRREIFLYENVRIHLDEVEGCGHFVEFEAVLGSDTGDAASQHRRLDWLRVELDLDAAEPVATSYEALVRAG